MRAISKHILPSLRSPDLHDKSADPFPWHVILCDKDHVTLRQLLKILTLDLKYSYPAGRCDSVLFSATRLLYSCWISTLYLLILHRPAPRSQGLQICPVDSCNPSGQCDPHTCRSFISIMIRRTCSAHSRFLNTFRMKISFMIVSSFITSLYLM